MLENALILVVLVGTAGTLIFHPRLAHSSNWKATFTPLASIMGSGFLACAPLLAEGVGYDAVPAMTLLLAVAFAIIGRGWVDWLRTNRLYFAARGCSPLS